MRSLLNPSLFAADEEVMQICVQSSITASVYGGKSFLFRSFAFDEIMNTYVYGIQINHDCPCGVVPRSFEYEASKTKNLVRISTTPQAVFLFIFHLIGCEIAFDAQVGGLQLWEWIKFYSIKW